VLYNNGHIIANSVKYFIAKHCKHSPNKKKENIIYVLITQTELNAITSSQIVNIINAIMDNKCNGDAFSTKHALIKKTNKCNTILQVFE